MARALVIAAPSSGSGKTLVTLGLLRAFRNRGTRIASAKIGPDYIDPGFHAAASGAPCYNLDPWAMGMPLIGHILDNLAAIADLVLIEGVMGLFDGPDGDTGSTADLAVELNLPVLLVADASRMSQSIGALVQGFASFRPEVRLSGVILNRVANERHEMMLRRSIGLPVMGVLRRCESLHLPNRHLGLIQAQEHQALEQFIETAASAVARETDLNEILTVAADIQPATAIRALPPLGQRIAIASDRAFAFAYPHLLLAWRNAGAEIMTFSPLAGEAPAADADAIFLPGGYPELFAGKIAANKGFFAGLRSATGLVYGECGGFMVLGDAIVDSDGERHPMAGLLPLTTSFAKRKLSLGYRELRPVSGAPWSKLLRGHEFHYSTVSSEGDADPLFAVADAARNKLGTIGLRRRNVMGSFAHVICERA